MKRAIVYAVIIAAAGGASNSYIIPKMTPPPPGQSGHSFDGTNVRDYTPGGNYRGQDVYPSAREFTPGRSIAPGQFDRNTGSPYGNGLGRR